MARGSGTLLLLLLLMTGSAGNPLPPQLFDVMAGDGMLGSGDGVSDILREWFGRDMAFLMHCIYGNGANKMRVQMKTEGLTSV